MDVLTFDELAETVSRRRRHHMADLFITTRMAVNGEKDDVKGFLRKLVPPEERAASEEQNDEAAFLALYGGGI